MGNFTSVQDNFSAGELSPNLKGRTDLALYNNALEEVLNFIPLKGGAARRRTGTILQGVLAHDITVWNEVGPAEVIQDVHIIPYKVSISEQYTVAIIKLQTKITIQFYNSTGSALDGTVSNLSSVLNTNYVPYSSDIHKFQFAQSGTLLILTHDSGDIPPLFITRQIISAATKWFLNFMCPVYTDATTGILNDNGNFNLLTYNYSSGGTGFYGGGSLADNNHKLPATSSLLAVPYTDINSSLIEVGGNIPAATALTSYRPYPTTYAFFTTKMLGSMFKGTAGSATGTTLITQFVSSSNVVTAQGLNFGANSKIWEISAWNSEFGFPRCVTFNGQRLILGSTKRQPDTFWGSEIGNYRNFMINRLAQDITSDTSGLNYFGPVTAVDPFSFTVASNELNKINWLMGTKSLYAGSGGTEYAIKGANGALSNVNFNIDPESNKGSSYVTPVAVDGSVVYVSRDGQKLYQLKYSEANGAIVSKDLSVQGEDIELSSLPFTHPGLLTFSHLALDKSNSLLYALKSFQADNVILQVGVDDTLDVLNWSKFKFTDISNVHAAEIKSMLSYVTYPGENLLICVQRFQYVPSTTWGFTFETIASPYKLSELNPALTFELPFYTDCSVRTIGNGVTTVIITHPFLKSVTVSGLADGVYFTAALNSSGVATLATPFTNAIFGLPYTSRIKTLPVNKGFETQGGSAILSKKRIDKLFVRMLKTRGLKYGPDTTNLLDMEFTGLGATALFSGDKSMVYKDSSDFPGQVILEISKPYPATILQIGVRGNTSEG